MIKKVVNIILFRIEIWCNCIYDIPCNELHFLHKFFCILNVLINDTQNSQWVDRPHTRRMRYLKNKEDEEPT